MGSGEHLFETRAIRGADGLSRVIVLGVAPIHAMLSIRHGRRSVWNFNNIEEVERASWPAPIFRTNRDKALIPVARLHQEVRCIGKHAIALASRRRGMAALPPLSHSRTDPPFSEHKI
jgi:hypothetical protein